MTQLILSLLEITGTVSFAVSGAFVAIKARLDLFGSIFVAAITAMGGGIVRDLLIGHIPPTAFLNFHIFAISAITAVIVFLIARKKPGNFDGFREKTETVNNFFDAIGLAAFSVMGTEVAFIEGFSDNMFLSVVLGMLTGVGGGIFRDILTDTTPYVFKKHIYALASIGGSIMYYILRRFTPGIILPSVSAMVVIVAVRLLATRYLWSLPKIKFDE